MSYITIPLSKKSILVLLDGLPDSFPLRQFREELSRLDMVQSVLGRLLIRIIGLEIRFRLYLCEFAYYGLGVKPYLICLIAV